ncbi:MAG: chemotaxis protein MotB [Alphaproteobacteria bacterium]|nr:chemotaxis protein MotB [Alphaproteobacteria bacterium]
MAGNLNELIFIKRVKKHPHEHAHGGAWKIAYADFVTAMMAFFLMLWLLNSTSKEQRNTISNYFAPQSASLTTSGAGGVLGGRVLDTEGALTASHSSPRIMLGAPQLEAGSLEADDVTNEGDREASGPVDKNEFEDANKADMGVLDPHDQVARDKAALGTLPPNDLKDATQASLGKAEEETGKDLVKGTGGAVGVNTRDSQGLLTDGGAAKATPVEESRFAEIETQLKARIEADKVLKDYRDNIQVERTAEGLRIQLLDGDKREMFPLGSAELLPHTEKLFQAVADLVKDQPNQIAISGHTDSIPFRGTNGYSNWELSTDRANASRRGLVGAGVPESRIARVVGKADTEPFDPVNTEAAINRRVSVVILRNPNLGAVAKAHAALEAAKGEPAPPLTEVKPTVAEPEPKPAPLPPVEPAHEPAHETRAAEQETAPPADHAEAEAEHEPPPSDEITDNFLRLR